MNYNFDRFSMTVGESDNHIPSEIIMRHMLTHDDAHVRDLGFLMGVLAVLSEETTEIFADPDRGPRIVLSAQDANGEQRLVSAATMEAVKTDYVKGI